MQKEYKKSLEYLEKCLKIQQSIVPADHVEIANTLREIGNVHYNQHINYDLALSYLEKALKMYQKVLPTNHSSEKYSNITYFCFFIIPLIKLELQ